MQNLLNFKQWLEMAMVSRQPLYVDENDIQYLKQFPLHYWTRALQYRYNDLIFKAFEHGELNPNWQDKQIVPIGRLKLHVNTDMNHVLQKLKNANYDLSGTNSLNQESLFYKPMTYGSAANLISTLKTSISPEAKQKYEALKKSNVSIEEMNAVLDPRPDFTYWSPNHMMQKRNDPEPTQDGSKEAFELFDRLKPFVIDRITHVIGLLDSQNNPNAVYWKQHRKELFDALYQGVQLNWKDTKLHTKQGLETFLRNRLAAKLQSGLISRRHDVALRDMGLNVHDLFSKVNRQTGKPWTMDDIKQGLDANLDHQSRYDYFTRNTSQARRAV